MDSTTTSTAISPESPTEKKQKLEQVAIRMPSADRERFTDFCRDNHLSQADAFRCLLDTHDFQQAAEHNPERADSLRSFQLHIQALLDLHTASLTLANDARDLARQEYATELSQNGQIIQTYQNQVNSLQAELTAMAAEKEQLAQRLQAAAEHTETLKGKCDQAQAQLADKVRLISILESKLPDTEELMKENTALRETVHKQNAEIASLRNDLQKSELQHMQELRRQDHAHAAELRTTEAELRTAEADKYKAQEALARAIAQLDLLQQQANDPADSKQD